MTALVIEVYPELTSRESDTYIASGCRMEPVTLPFHKLADRHPGVTAAIGNGFTEAARVCLDRHHISPIGIVIQRPSASEPEVKEVIAIWEETTQRERNAWANAIDATEAGAYGFALALVELEGLVAVRRAETGTGADYYISPPGFGVDDLEDCIRLEVSGSIEETKGPSISVCVKKFNKRCLDPAVFPRSLQWLAFARGSSLSIERREHELGLLARN
jgi:hypothetical protein